MTSANLSLDDRYGDFVVLIVCGPPLVYNDTRRRKRALRDDLPTSVRQMLGRRWISTVWRLAALDIGGLQTAVPQAPHHARLLST